MEPIKISVSVELNLSQATKDFILSVFDGKVATPAPQAPAKPAAPQAPVAPAKPAAEAPKPAVPQEPATPAKPAAEAPSINIETVRQALAAKVNSHREEIKAKLNELGSPSVTKLDPAKYGEMLNFLNSLS